MLRQGLQEEEQADNTVVQGIYKLPRAAIINPHELGCLNNRNTLPHNSEAGGPRSRAWQGECLPRVMRDNLFQVSPRFLHMLSRFGLPTLWMLRFGVSEFCCVDCFCLIGSGLT